MLNDATILQAFGVYPRKYIIHVLNNDDLHRLEKEYKLKAMRDIGSPLGKYVILEKLNDRAFETLRIACRGDTVAEMQRNKEACMQPAARSAALEAACNAYERQRAVPDADLNATDKLWMQLAAPQRGQLRIADDGVSYSWDEFKEWYWNKATWYWNRARISFARRWVARSALNGSKLLQEGPAVQVQGG